MPARPKKGARFGGSAAHQKAMMANLVASLIAAEHHHDRSQGQGHATDRGEDDHEGQEGGVHNHRNVVKFLRDREMASKLFDEIGPRYAEEERNGGYLRIIKLDLRPATTRRWRESSSSELLIFMSTSGRFRSRRLISAQWRTIPVPSAPPRRPRRCARQRRARPHRRVLRR